MNAKKEAIAQAPVRRVRRSPLGTKNVLTISGKDPAFDYRIVNDVGDRINEFLDNGWEVCSKDDLRIGDKRLGQSTSEDSIAKASVGRGTVGYVLRIRKEWREEDEQAKQAAVDATEQAMKADALNGTYGKLEISRD